MEEFNQLFRNRIGMSETEEISFEKLDQVLEKTALSIPFENTSIIFRQSYKITKESLANKILMRNEGGLCYELNPVLYYFLLENGFNVCLVRGIVYNQPFERWSPTGRTHTAILLTHDDQIYLIDTGFGVNLPLKPVPLNGQIIRSTNGEFRVNPFVHNDGDYVLVMKLKHKDTEWSTGYIFDTARPVSNLSELDEIQQIIGTHPDSSFNKHPLMTKLINNGHITLTDTSFTQYMNGKARKEAIDNNLFKGMAKSYFSMTI